MAFDPSAAAQPGSGVFGLPHSEAEAGVVLVPVPFEATTSYGGGTSGGPEAILAASRQVDLFDVETNIHHGMQILGFYMEMYGDLETAHTGLDVLGVNYYSTHRVQRYVPDHEKVSADGHRESEHSCWVGADAVEFLPQPGPHTAMGWNIDPGGMTELLVGLHARYPDLPLVVTENGAAFDDVVSPDGRVQPGTTRDRQENSNGAHERPHRPAFDRHLLEGGDVDLDVEVTRVADDRAVFHEFEMLLGEHVLVAGHGAENVAKLGGFFHRHHAETVHHGFESFRRIDFGDDDFSAIATRTAGESPAAPSVAGDDEF